MQQFPFIISLFACGNCIRLWGHNEVGSVTGYQTTNNCCDFVLFLNSQP